MSSTFRLAVVSDIHYAGAIEAARGHPRDGLTGNPFLNLGMRAWDRLLWMNDPRLHNHLVERFTSEAGEPDLVVANGDFSCDAASVGVSDDGALASATECLGKLRARFGGRLLATIGDHELGKKSFVGGKGGMRLASWPRTVGELGLISAWKHDLGACTLVGVTSSLVGLEILRHDILPEEEGDWEKLRAAHVAEIESIFASLDTKKRVLLFCHDPSALPFLGAVPGVRARLGQIESTIVGHLHSGLIFNTARLLSGMPSVGFLGNTLRRWTAALNRARQWRQFKPVLCPALAGIELTKRGGWLEVELEAEGKAPATFRRRIIKR